MNRIYKVRLGSRFSRGVLATLAVASLMFCATGARASCVMSGSGSGSTIKLPMLGMAGGGQEDSWQGSNDSIVGLWGVVYTSGGKVFNQTFDEWHSDGTEFENAFLNPVQGNICFGAWKHTGPRTVKLHHIGWTFTVGNTGTATGVFTLDENNTVSSDGKTYTGTFTFTAFNIQGQQQGQPITGTILATRITAD